MKLKEFASFIIPFIIFAIPLILMQLVQYDLIKPINSFISCNKLPNTRGNEMNLDVLKNIGSLKNVFIQDVWIFNSIPGYGTLYFIGLIFIPGAFISFRNAIYKKSFIDFLMNVWFFTGIIWCLVVECNVNRLNGIYIPIMYYIALIIKFIIDKEYYRLFFGIIVVYLISFIMFVNSYFKMLSKNDLPLFDNGMIEIVEHVKKEYGNIKNIYFELNEYNYWIYEAFVEQLSPSEYVNSFKRNGLLNVSIGRYYNGEIDVNRVDDESIYILNNPTKEEILINKNFRKDGFKSKYSIYYK